VSENKENGQVGVIGRVRAAPESIADAGFWLPATQAECYGLRQFLGILGDACTAIFAGL